MRRRTLKRLLAEEKVRNEQLLEQRDEAREDARANMYAAKRTAQHNTALREQVDKLRAHLGAEHPDSDAAYILQLENRVERLQRAAGRWMGAAWNARRAAASRGEATRTQLLDAARPYERRLAELQTANERCARGACS